MPARCQHVRLAFQRATSQPHLGRHLRTSSVSTSQNMSSSPRFGGSRLPRRVFSHGEHSPHHAHCCTPAPHHSHAHHFSGVCDRYTAPIIDDARPSAGIRPHERLSHVRPGSQAVLIRGSGWSAHVGLNGFKHQRISLNMRCRGLLLWLLICGVPRVSPRS